MALAFVKNTELLLDPVTATGIAEPLVSRLALNNEFLRFKSLYLSFGVGSFGRHRCDLFSA